MSEVPGSSSRLRVVELLLGSLGWSAVIIVMDPGGLPDANPAAALDSGDVQTRLAVRGLESAAITVDTATYGGTNGDKLLVTAIEDIAERIRARGWLDQQIGLFGSGPGGRAVLLASELRTFGAAVSWLPAGLDAGSSAGLDASVSTLRTSWLGLFRGAPDAAEHAALTDWEQRMRRRSRTHTRVVHYRDLAGLEETAESTQARAAGYDAWQRSVEWFENRLEPTPTPMERIFRLAHAREQD